MVPGRKIPKVRVRVTLGFTLEQPHHRSYSEQPQSIHGVTTEHSRSNHGAHKEQLRRTHEACTGIHGAHIEHTGSMMGHTRSKHRAYAGIVGAYTEHTWSIHKAIMEHTRGKHGAYREHSLGSFGVYDVSLNKSKIKIDCICQTSNLHMT